MKNRRIRDEKTFSSLVQVSILTSGRLLSLLDIWIFHLNLLEASHTRKNINGDNLSKGVVELLKKFSENKKIQDQRRCASDLNQICIPISRTKAQSSRSYCKYCSSFIYDHQ